MKREKRKEIMRDPNVKLLLRLYKQGYRTKIRRAGKVEEFVDPPGNRRFLIILDRYLRKHYGVNLDEVVRR